MSYREKNSIDLVKQWNIIVNDNFVMGRDAHLLKEALNYLTPCQILLGMYQYRNNKTISISMFLKARDEWLEEDENWAEVELAICISNKIPPEYYTYKDNIEEETATAFNLSLAARLKLRTWADRILS